MGPKGNTRNLRPFRKGQSGNPKGRPKTLGNIRALLVERYGDDAWVLIDRLDRLSKLVGLRHARLAMAATELLMAYHSGKPKQSFDVDTTPHRVLVIQGGRYPDCGNDPLPGWSGSRDRVPGDGNGLGVGADESTAPLRTATQQRERS